MRDHDQVNPSAYGLFQQNQASVLRGSILFCVWFCYCALGVSVVLAKCEGVLYQLWSLQWSWRVLRVLVPAFGLGFL
ncbi:hypothetical protein U1Q18_007726, partial [Sarracenia purpurea var. burkii]